MFTLCFDAYRKLLLKKCLFSCLVIDSHLFCQGLQSLLFNSLGNWMSFPFPVQLSFYYSPIFVKFPLLKINVTYLGQLSVDKNADLNNIMAAVCMWCKNLYISQQDLRSLQKQVQDHYSSAGLSDYRSLFWCTVSIGTISLQHMFS